MVSFDEKVAALQRLREARQARTAAQAGREEPAPAWAEPEPEAPGQATSQAAAVPPKGDVVPRVVDVVPKAEVEEFQDSATFGNADAQFCIGHLCERGEHGSEPDPKEAAAWYAKAAESGHAAAQWRLGALYEAGNGVEKSDARAALWYQRAAVAGHDQAQSCLAILYEEGRGVDMDDAKAVRWHLAAAEQGHALSMYCLAACHADGRGTDQDRSAAEHWFKKSAAAGFAPALEALEELEDVEEESGPVVNGAADDDENHMSLTDLAHRVASALKSVDDGEAARLLDELLTMDPDFDEDDELAEQLQNAVAAKVGELAGGALTGSAPAA